ncbi:hypothetical protein C1645_731325 [Glomus cerebriforme]|uniref:Uncharacterized protein n=1 Tax=Glomus cerebriforme TaxID=658196 RepID=A0A397TKU2_9GLOM|nr:hypothetical protein C1645_731325 [Glomus cerebriforme]
MTVHNNFPVNKVMVLSPYTEKVPELISTFVLDKDKGKKQEHIAERDLRTISSSTSLNTMQVDDENHNHNKNKGKGKGKECEHITEGDLFCSNFSFTSSNTIQIDNEYDIPKVTSTKIRPAVINYVPVEQQLCEPNYIGCIIKERGIPKPKSTNIRFVVNETPLEQLLYKPNYVCCIKKVISFFNSYDYSFNIFDIVIDFSDKYQEIFPEDNFRLQPFYNNPCVLLEMLNNLLLYRLNIGVDNMENFVKLEMLAEEYYEKLINAETSRQELYNTSFINRKSCKSIRNSHNNNSPVSSENFKINQIELHDSSKSFKRSRVDQDLNSTAQSSKSFERLQSFQNHLPPLSQNSNTSLSVLSLSSKQIFENQRFSSSDTSRCTEYIAQQTNISYETNLNPCKQADDNTCKHVTDSPHFKKMMANAIQQLAIANLIFKRSPETSPSEMHRIMDKLHLKEMGKTYGSIMAYQEYLINEFNQGGMDKVLKGFEESIFTYLSIKRK